MDVWETSQYIPEIECALTIFSQGVFGFTKKKVNIEKCFRINPKATERQTKVQYQILFPFSFNNVEFLADFVSCNSLALAQRKHT